MFLDDIGNVWSCGGNKDEQLRLGNRINQIDRLPTKNEYFDKSKIRIVEIESGWNLSLATDEYSKCYVDECGVNNKYATMVLTPTLIKIDGFGVDIKGGL